MFKAVCNIREKECLRVCVKVKGKRLTTCTDAVFNNNNNDNNNKCKFDS